MAISSINHLWSIFPGVSRNPQLGQTLGRTLELRGFDAPEVMPIVTGPSGKKFSVTWRRRGAQPFCPHLEMFTKMMVDT